MSNSPTPAPAGTGTATDAELIDAASDANIAYGGAADGSAEGSVACDKAVQAEEAILARLASLRSESEWRRDQIAALALKLSDAESSVATLTRQLAEAQQREQALTDRVKLLDRVIGDHHASSVMREEHDVCPVCMAAGGVEFFCETSRLLRAVPTTPDREAGC